jgi:hypothetical protein
VGRVKILKQSSTRFSSILFASLFIMALASQLLVNFGATAAGLQLQSRSIQLSNDAPSTTSVTYTVTFTPQSDTPTTHPDVIVDFCNGSSDPIVGDTCSGTAGTDVPNVSSVPSSCASGWTCTSIDSNHGLYLTTSTLSFTSGTPVTIAITGVTNMSNVGTTGSPNAGNFYGRILDYATGGGSTHTSASPGGSYVDYGGIALSTSTVITINSKVFETLSFCVFLATNSCGTAPTFTLGNPTTQALSTASVYVAAGSSTLNDGPEYSISTNAAHGASIYMTGETLCNKALTQANCLTSNGADAANLIPALGTTSTVATAGTAGFGMCENASGITAIGGTVTVPAEYTDSNSTHSCNFTSSQITSNAYSATPLPGFGFDDTASTGTNSTAGSTIMTATGPVNAGIGYLSFAADISNTTTAGIYQSQLSLTATGTF